MPKTDIKLYSTEPSGKATTATISDVNPEATNAQLKTLGQMLNAFTRNRYDKTNRINTIQCDTEEGDEKQTATLTATPNPISWATFKAAIANNGVFEITLTYDGDANGFFVKNVYTFVTTRIENSKIICSSSLQAAAIPDYSQAIADNPLGIETEETDNFKAATLTIPFTA